MACSLALLEDRFPADGATCLRSGATQSRYEELCNGLTALRPFGKPSRHSPATRPRISLVFRIAIFRRHLRALPPFPEALGDRRSGRDTDEFFNRVAM